MNGQIYSQYFTILKENFPVVVYKNEEIVTHRSHIPRVGMILIEGEIELIKTKTSTLIKPCQSVGIIELWNKTPTKYKIKVFPGTTVLSLDLSTLKSLVDQNIIDQCHFSLG